MVTENTIGIDIGGTQLRAAVVRPDGTILSAVRLPNDRSLTGPQNMDRLLPFIEQLDIPFRAVGLGVPGPIDLAAGLMLHPPNLVGWDDFPIVRYIEQRAQRPVVMNNDGNVAALAEAILGSGRGWGSVVYMTVSTGVGGGFIHRGEIISGANGNAAELWNLVVSDDTHCHKNANPGSLNEQCSGSGLAVLAGECYGEPTDARALFDRFYAGDESAARLIEYAAEMMGRGIANIMCMMDPDVIVVGGSVALRNPQYVKMFVDRAKRYLIRPEALRVVEAALGDDAGLIGAALLAQCEA